MYIPYEIFVGWRYVRNRKQIGRENRFISFISSLSMAGIALGVAALIVVLSVMNGFQKEIQERILSATSHIEVVGVNGTLEDWHQIQFNATQNKHVVASAPYTQGQVMVSTQGVRLAGEGVRGAMIRGIDPSVEPTVSDFSRKIKSGDFNALEPGEFKVAIGEELARSLGVKVGDKITVVSPEGTVTPAGVIPRIKSFEIAAIFNLGMYEYDSGLVLANIQDTQALFRLGDQVSGVRLKVDEPYKAAQIAHEIAPTLQEDAFLTDWTKQHANFFRAIQIEKRMMFIILSLIVAVAAFNIVSTLVMAVTDKRSDIAILRTIGASARSIMAIFILQGAFIGAIGLLIGAVGGTVMALNIDTVVPFIEHLFGVQFLSGDIYFLSELPSDLQWADVINITVSAFILTLLSTIYPSIRAAKIQPAEALRYE